jgi:hypothetical protein
MKTKPTAHLLALILFIGSVALPQAQTVVCGPTSGTWTPAGNPYNIVCNASVPPGSTLTIQPGCQVIIGPGVSLIASNSLIEAVGTANQRISFQFSDITNSFIWVRDPPGTPPGTNRFKYCDFTNGHSAIAMSQWGGQKSIFVEVMNCTFTGCGGQAIWMDAQGLDFSPLTSGTAQVNPTIENCIFDNTTIGCTLWIHSVDTCCSGPGYSYPVIKGNVFRNLTGIGIYLAVNDRGGPSSPIIVNNAFVGCQIGIQSGDPWTNGVVQNNIFYGSSNAMITTSAALSGTVSYNDYYHNTANFIGYPPTYGVVVTANRNGTPSDLSYNIFQDPLFAGPNDFHLTPGSACIDAGEGSATNDDRCFPPSLGSAINDIGAYGGPTVCPPSQPVAFAVSISKYVGISFTPPGNGSYRLEYASALGATTTNWFPLTNVNLTTPFTYFDPIVSGQRFYRMVFLP